MAVTIARPSERPLPEVPPHTAFVLLDYCGGGKTDRLFRRIARWNPGAQMFLLDNGSPTRRARLATHRNAENSYVGGGICDVIALAEGAGAKYLFFCVNDVGFEAPLEIAAFERMMETDDDLVQVSCALTPDSVQAAYFPWMVRRAEGGVRQVRFADLICCLLRLDHIRSFGGFPPSRGGWGYAEEVAHHARLRDKRIYVCDRVAVRHVRENRLIHGADGTALHKRDEAHAVYARRYGSFDALLAVRERSLCDEERNILSWDDLGIPPNPRPGGFATRLRHPFRRRAKAG
jgi:hypothetical protein